MFRLGGERRSCLSSFTQLLGDLAVAQTPSQGPWCLHPQFPQPMADPQGKARIAQQMVKQFPFHRGDDVAGGAMVAGGFKPLRRLAQTLIGRTEQVFIGQAMAEGEASGLLMGQAQMGPRKGPLLMAHRLTVRPPLRAGHGGAAGAGGYPWLRGQPAAPGPAAVRRSPHGGWCDGDGVPSLDGV